MAGGFEDLSKKHSFHKRVKVRRKTFLLFIAIIALPIICTCLYSGYECEDDCHENCENCTEHCRKSYGSVDPEYENCVELCLSDLEMCLGFCGSPGCLL